MILSLSSFSRLRARTRLLLAFTILSVSAMILALVGWQGLSNTDRALNIFEQQALPDISRSLELAERTANLAAIAPYVTSAGTPYMLEGLSQTLKAKIEKVLSLAQRIPQLDAAAPNLQKLLQRLDSTVNELIDLTRQHLFLREDLREYEYRLRSLIDGTEPFDTVHSATPVTRLAEMLMTASHSQSADSLAITRQRFIRQLDSFHRSAAGGADHDYNELYAVGAGPENLFDLRLKQLSLEQRSAFLLASTRAISEQLSGEVQHFVDQIQSRISHESQRVGAAVSSGKTGILLISFLCIVAALGGVWMVRELVMNLASVTLVMSRLAEGDTHQQTPAIERSDEIGDLARAFQVFRENAVQIDRISHDLQEQSHLLETVFTNINDGLSVFDREGRLIAWNPQYLLILELPQDSLQKGMSIEQVHGLLSQEAQESWALDGMALDKDEVNQMRRQQPQHFERHFANGRVVEFRSSPMPDGGFVTLYSDLTERKTVEAQLRQSQKMEVLGQLTGGVAHDFNNLLAAMYGNLQLLESTLYDAPKPLKYARRALASAERGKNLTQRLLAFSRKQHLTPEPTAVDPLIEGMLDLIEYSVGSAIKIKLDLGAADWLVDVDPGQLENALLNLTINSSAAMPEGGTLTFCTRQCHAIALNGSVSDAVHIEVSDTGCGISEAHLRRVFEPFFTTKEIGQGSGLGLSMVYGFVKQSEGDIRVRSQQGQGTTIGIYLRRKAESAALPRADTVTTFNYGQNRCVLMVEDDHQVRDAGQALLEKLEYRVIAVASVDEALQQLDERDDIDIVFTDINLGTAVNGLDLAKKIDSQWPEIPVLLTSGLSVQHLSEQYGLQQTGIVLAKPYKLEELAMALDNTFTRHTDQGGRDL
ncbi:PAS-domain containing protein [Amphritea pacifica]|uniref:PAS-domain containing protein n=1 Tax=Amphritea pacifica TaxID=2811233 RepID=UPI0019654FD7|nr:PAS-domain containing protein [Amphritea pacifica]MBN1009018.1 PAS-domain containing protein [Amphritea pacifica]